MSAKGHKRGHPVVYLNGAWRWTDTEQRADGERPCVQCGETASLGGPDPCLGWIPGARSACCGHGTEESYIVLDSGESDQGAPVLASFAEDRVVLRWDLSEALAEQIAERLREQCDA